jgi:GNAT superfamily N-acetyltransferase
MTAKIEVKELAPALLDDFLDLFDRRAFVDNPGWASCFCQFYLADHAAKEWDERSGEENRAAACERICAARMRGWLAYRDAKAIGWLHAAPLAWLPNLAAEPHMAGLDPRQTGALACFVVDPQYRRSGVGRALLRAAVQGFRRAGLTCVVGCPRPGREDAAGNYHGPLDLYLSEGFQVFRELPNLTLVRLEIS